MRDRQNAVLDALQRAQRFLDENSALLTGVVDLAAARKRLDDVVATFTGHAFDQDVGDRNAKGETAKQRQNRIAGLCIIIREVPPDRTSSVRSRFALISSHSRRHLTSISPREISRKCESPSSVSSNSGRWIDGGGLAARASDSSRRPS